MKPASTKPGSRLSTSQSKVPAASAAPHHRPSVPGTPKSQRPSVPRPPSHQGPSVPGTPTSQGPSVPGTPTYLRPSVPGTPISQGPSVPGTPISQGSSVPGTPISQGPSVPGTPSRQRSLVRSTPSSYRPTVRSTPSSYRPTVRSTPSSYRPTVRSTPSSYRPTVRSTPSSYRPTVRSTPSSQRPSVHSIPSTKSLQSVHRDHTADKLPRKHTKHEKVRPTRPAPVSEKIKIPETVKIQDKDRVSKRFRDGFCNFCCSANGMLKALRMCITAASVFCFVIGGAQDLFVAIMIQETCIVLFFIIIYLIALQHFLTCIHWPLLDLINTLISMAFLGIVSIITMTTENSEKNLTFIGGVLCFSAAVLCVIDALLVTEKMRHKAKSSLGKKTKPSTTRRRQKQR
ncbi:CKLF-like MARVEL transmembrane domain-containing protein 1 [Rattus norvegicus]|uniref:CKLF-like MARVEL transmembrane domain containing 1 n=1 Tax=Rattus norvegicus TaxID=10116 RepID=Q4QQS9_RAT|nr:CKLF-like MARVEL transmembrane domain-containing protein 1 [Rattus norvegicus]AAH98029.1 CKLF-like MARVEL transmembrane domain containing 1 [Rattus norvegicus]|eukprot:NP_001025085.1 CKLF-like MARVEL transmembrane domain-containing protein 1 [Rattus norvegicus]